MSTLSLTAHKMFFSPDSHLSIRRLVLSFNQLGEQNRPLSYVGEYLCRHSIGRFISSAAPQSQHPIGWKALLSLLQKTNSLLGGMATYFDYRPAPEE